MQGEKKYAQSTEGGKSMNDLVKINYDNADKPTVSGRELYDALGVKTAYKDWFPRMCEYGFSEGEDYCSFLSNRSDGLPGKPRTDHQLTIPMAKEICMLQRTEKGREIRRYFISVEEQWNSPDAIMARALQLSNAKLKQLQVTVSELTVENQIMKPKADYFDQLVDRNLLTNIRDTAKELKIKQNDFVSFLLGKKYLYRDKRGKLLPYAKSLDDGLFEIKEFTNEKTGFSSSQTLVSPKGRETFRLLIGS